MRYATALFTDVPEASISQIFQVIGCQHTLQPTSNDFAPPSTPCLTTRGFVRWEAIETLLDPEEHVPFMQFAVRNFAITHPETGRLFPADLPREAFPLKADVDIETWHRACAERLREEATPEDSDIPSTRPNLPPRPGKAGFERFRDRDPYSPGRSTRERQGGADYFNSRPIPYQHVSSASMKPAFNRPASQRPYLSPEDESPRAARSRRRSVPENYYPSSPQDPNPVVEPSSQRSVRSSSENHGRRHSHPRNQRSPSTSSSSAASDDDDICSSVSVSPEPKSPRRKGPPHTQSSLSNIRTTVPQSPAVKAVPLSYQGHRVALPQVRVDPRLATYKVPIDLAGKLSAPFMGSSRDSVSRSNSRSGSVRWKGRDEALSEPKRRGSEDLERVAKEDDSHREKYRREDPGLTRPRLGSTRSGSHDGRNRLKEGDRRERDRDRDRDSWTDKDEREVEMRRERRRYVSPPRGVDGRRYAAEGAARR
jgi:hypothetical protein